MPLAPGTVDGVDAPLVGDVVLPGTLDGDVVLLGMLVLGTLLFDGIVVLLGTVLFDGCVALPGTVEVLLPGTVEFMLPAGRVVDGDVAEGILVRCGDVVVGMVDWVLVPGVLEGCVLVPLGIVVEPGCCTVLPGWVAPGSVDGCSVLPGTVAGCVVEPVELLPPIPPVDDGVEVCAKAAVEPSAINANMFNLNVFIMIYI